MPEAIRESTKTLSRMVDRMPNAALVPPLLLADRNQFVCVIDGAG
jgi:hypothetical protein